MPHRALLPPSCCRVSPRPRQQEAGVPGPLAPTARLLAQGGLTSDLRAQLPGFPSPWSLGRTRAGDGEEGGASPC